MQKKGMIIKAVILAAAAAGFVIVMCMVMNNSIDQLDTRIAAAVYSIRSADLSIVMEGITYLGNWEAIVIVCILLLAYPGMWKEWGLPAAGAAVTAQLIKSVIKPIVHRPRPDVSLHLIEQGGWSFPSGHAITSMALYGILFFIILANMEKSAKKTALLILTAVLSFMIGITRIYLGVHFPSDVLAGWLGGIAVIAGVLMIRDAVRIRMSSR